MATRKKPRPGDLLRVSVDGSCAHLHYLGRHPEYGDAVRVVLSEGIPNSATEQDALLAGGYVAFYPVLTAAAQGLVEPVGHRDKGALVPTALRRPGARSGDGRVLAWIIEDLGTERVASALTPAERKLPIAVIWNHEMLCTRIREGWEPESEGA